MKRREVIALDNIVPGKVTYFAACLQWDAAWHSPEINRAKVFRHPGLASATIDARGAAWLFYNPRIVDPRTVAGYKDKPSAAEKRQAKKWNRP